MGYLHGNRCFATQAEARQSLCRSYDAWLYNGDGSTAHLRCHNTSDFAGTGTNKLTVSIMRNFADGTSKSANRLHTWPALPECDPATWQTLTAPAVADYAALWAGLLVAVVVTAAGKAVYNYFRLDRS